MHETYLASVRLSKFRKSEVVSSSKIFNFCVEFKVSFHCCILLVFQVKKATTFVTTKVDAEDYFLFLYEISLAGGGRTIFRSSFLVLAGWIPLSQSRISEVRALMLFMKERMSVKPENYRFRLPKRVETQNKFEFTIRIILYRSLLP